MIRLRQKRKTDNTPNIIKIITLKKITILAKQAHNEAAQFKQNYNDFY